MCYYIILRIKLWFDNLWPSFWLWIISNQNICIYMWICMHSSIRVYKVREWWFDVLNETSASLLRKKASSKLRIGLLKIKPKSEAMPPWAWWVTWLHALLNSNTQGLQSGRQRACCRRSRCMRQQNFLPTKLFGNIPTLFRCWISPSKELLTTSNIIKKKHSAKM